MKHDQLATLAILALLVGCESGVTGPDTAEVQSATAAANANAVAGSVTGSAHFLAFSLDQCIIGNPGCPAPPGIATRDMAFQARVASDGSATGLWQSVAGSAVLHGSIDCVTIAPDGESARLSGLVTSAQFTLFEPGTAFAMEVFDNSAGGSGTPDASTAIRAFRNLPPEVGRAFCETGAVPEGAELAVVPSAEGNVTIRVDG